MRNRLLLIAAVALLGHAQSATAQSEAEFPRLEDVLTPTQVHSAGLEKLSRAESDSLNSYVRRYVRVAIRVSLAKPAAQPAVAPGASADALESNIDGTFNGWDGETVFPLINGQIWQQSSYAYLYHYAYRPKVLIYSSGGGYKMHVDGVDETISVRRLK